MSPQQQMISERKRKKTDKKLQFDATKTFDAQPSEDIQLDEEMSRYKAKKGQGGDRREK